MKDLACTYNKNKKFILVTSVYPVTHRELCLVSYDLKAQKLRFTNLSFSSMTSCVIFSHPFTDNNLTLVRSKVF